MNSYKFILLLLLLLSIFLTSLVGSVFAANKKDTVFLYKIKNARDPFTPLVTPEGKIINLEPQSEISDINLEGIIYDPEGNSFVVVSGDVFAEGEFIGKFKLEKIKKDKIILQNGENTHIIELIKEVESEQ